MNVMKWKKYGRIFDPTNRAPFMMSYAQNPNALEADDRLRIFFTCRGEKSSTGFISQTAYADFEKEPPFKLIEVASNPVMTLGGPGDFDEFGIMPGSVISVPESNEVWMYYVGWTRMVSVPYKWQVGLAISEDGGKSFRRYSRGPILGGETFDPYLQACPRVWRFGPHDWLMYYNSGTEWNTIDNKMESVYLTRKAISCDGINWSREEPLIIPTKVESECQTSASLFRTQDRWAMLFSYRYGLDFRNRDKGYRIGLIHSDDRENWRRDDDVFGINVSDSGWDSEMLCYPHVFDLNSKKHVLYCGNYFGRDGFGIAELIEN